MADALSLEERVLVTTTDSPSRLNVAQHEATGRGREDKVASAEELTKTETELHKIAATNPADANLRQIPIDRAANFTRPDFTAPDFTALDFTALGLTAPDFTAHLACGLLGLRTRSIRHHEPAARQD